MPIVSARWQALVLALLFVLATALGVAEILTNDNDYDGLQAAAAELIRTGEFAATKAIRRYPPSFQVLMLPFGAVPVWLGGLLFTALSLAALVDLPRRLEQLGGVSPARQALAWWAVLPFTLDILRLAQNGILLLWLVVVGLTLARRHAPVLGGALLAVAALAKLLPALFLALPWWLARSPPADDATRADDTVAPSPSSRGPRAALGALFALALIFGASLAVTSTDSWRSALDNWWTISRETQTPWAFAATGASSRYNNQGLGIVLARTLGDMGPPAVLADGAVNIAHWPWTLIWSIYGALCALVAAVVLRAALAARRLASARPDLAWGGAFGIGACTILLASPLVWTHYYLWALPALCALSHRRRLVGTLAVLSTLGLADKHLRGLGAHTWIVFALLVLLMGELVRQAREQRAEAQTSSA